MRDEIKAQVATLVREGNAVKLVELIEHEYEFDCPSFVYAGPGHQSRHTCTNDHPHPLDGEHRDDLYTWIGTASFEQLDEVCIVCEGTGTRREFRSTVYPGGKPCHACDGTGHRRKLINTHHEGYGCEMCRIPDEAYR